jgi:hypothetical protein
MSTLPPTRLTPAPRLSVFVDAENIPVTHAQTILDLALRYGDPDLLRAYGNVGLLPDWDKLPGFQFIHSGCGKNATDMLICVDAMERALSDQCAAVFLVSSDQDFTHLATRLRGYGLTVIGAGEAKTSMRFRAACSVFEELEGCREPENPIIFDETDARIHRIIKRDSKQGKGVAVTYLSNQMRTEHQFCISKHPDKTWKKYLSNRKAIYDVTLNDGLNMVRYRPEAFRLATA